MSRGVSHATEIGMKAVRNSVIADLGLVSARVVVAILGGSAALAADSLHGLADLTTTLFLGAAFILAGKSATSEYTYGFHRAEDLAGLVVLIFLGISTYISGSTSLNKLLKGTETTYLLVGMGVALIGLVGKEAIAYYKIRAGREINSLSLIADGKHSVRARWAGHLVFCEMHILVRDEVNICEAHEIGKAVSEEVKKKVEPVEECLVHLGPESCTHGEGE